MGRPRKEKPNHVTGMYEVKVTIGHDVRGNLIRKSFYSSVSKADAKAKADAYKVAQSVKEITGEDIADQRTVTFETWAKKVLANLKGTVKDSSYNLTYKNSIEKHLIPHFGRAAMHSIRQIDIQSYFTKKGKTHSLESLKKHKLALNKIFEMAVINDICQKNPCIGIKLKSDIKQAAKHTYTKEQCALVLAYAKTHRFGLGVHLMLSYGLSRSELLGLMWDDVDAERKTINIERGVTDVQDASTGKMGVVIGEPKNEFRKRILPFSTETLELLRKAKNGNRFVICSKSGDVCSPRTWSRRHYDVFMEDMHAHYLEQDPPIDVPILTPHELRHTRASIWVNDGENIFAVADVLGHADLKMLRKRYAHADVESTRKLLSIE